MTFEDVAGRPVSRETIAWLERYGAMVAEENERQNLVASSTLSKFRERHIFDSLQLVRQIPIGSTVCDIGSGAGLPGIVIATCRQNRVTLIEPRRLRAEFLARVVDALGLDADVVTAKADRVKGRFDVITARAVAPIDALVRMTRHLSHSATTWVLPKGRTVQSELEVLRRNWQCDVGEVASVTDPDSSIVTLRNVSAKANR